MSNAIKISIRTKKNASMIFELIQYVKNIFPGTYNNVTGGNVIKYIDIYNRNFYRIYFLLYLSNNFSYCTI